MDRPHTASAAVSGRPTPGGGGGAMLDPRAGKDLNFKKYFLVLVLLLSRNA